MTEMRQPQRPPTALQRVVDEDEQLVGRFPALAAPIYAAVTMTKPSTSQGPICFMH